MTRVLFRTPLVAVLCAAALAACSKGEKTADSAKPADSATAGATTTSTVTPAPAPAPLNDANIVALLDAANMADSANGSVAATKGTSAEVKAFGRDMMRDHHALRKAGQDLATKANITPAMPAGDTTAANAAAFKDSLTTLAAGPAWDKTYISHEVLMHQNVLNMAQTAQGAAQNADLKALIEKAAPNIQMHLDHAKSIQSKLP